MVSCCEPGIDLCNIQGLVFEFKVHGLGYRFFYSGLVVQCFKVYDYGYSLWVHV